MGMGTGMPKRLVRIPARAWASAVASHPQAVLGVLTFALVIALGFAVAGWSAARNAEQRVSRVELLRAADIAAAEQGRKISQVVTCFNAAKGRPPLTTILRALASRELDPAVRAAFEVLITSYETASTPGIEGQPTEDKCIALAKKLGIDPSPYDFQA
jgi:hypothetical protein